MQPNDFPLPTQPVPTPSFSFPDALARLASILTDDEVGAIAPLVEQHKRLPEGMVRWRGDLYIRYFSTFWGISNGELARLNGMFPNSALMSGVEKLEIE